MNDSNLEPRVHLNPSIRGAAFAVGGILVLAVAVLATGGTEPMTP
jgi:hypothetical protein